MHVCSPILTKLMHKTTSIFILCVMMSLRRFSHGYCREQSYIVIDAINRVGLGLVEKQLNSDNRMATPQTLIVCLNV